MLNHRKTEDQTSRSDEVALPVAAAASMSADALEERYAAMVEQKYLRGLSKQEEAEIADLSQQLSAADSEFYDPILWRLRSRSAHLVVPDILIEETSR